MQDPDFDYEISSWWRLAEKLSVIEATLLILGIEPQGNADTVDNSNAAYQPTGYLAVKAAIVAGLQSKALKGYLINLMFQNSMGNWEEDHTRYDLANSRVEVGSLISWLSDRGFSSGYFFADGTSKQGFRDKGHPRYARKLAAAVAAWEAYDESESSVGTAKQQMQKWLRLNAAAYGLTDDDGKPSESVISSIAQMSNWATAGGAPKIAAPDSEDNILDDEIPF